MGITALHFTRARYYDSDYARAARQQQVIRALARKYSDPETDVRIGRLLGTVAGLETNLPLEDLKTLDGDGAARQPGQLQHGGAHAARSSRWAGATSTMGGAG